VCVCVCLCVEVSVCEVQRNAWKEFTAERLPYNHLQTASGFHNQEATHTLSSVPFATGCEVRSFTLSEDESYNVFQNIITSELFGSKSDEVKKETAKYCCIMSTLSVISFGPTKYVEAVYYSTYASSFWIYGCQLKHFLIQWQLTYLLTCC
jgi:hypothetical protein